MQRDPALAQATDATLFSFLAHRAGPDSKDGGRRHSVMPFGPLSAFIELESAELSSVPRMSARRPLGARLPRGVAARPGPPGRAPSLSGAEVPDGVDAAAEQER